MVNVFDSYSLVVYAENNEGASVWVNRQNIMMSVEVFHDEGFMVALPGSEVLLGKLYAPRIEEFIRTRPLISEGTHYLGLFYNVEYTDYDEFDANWYLEETVWIERYADAIRMAKIWNQKSIWDIFNRQVLEVS